MKDLPSMHMLFVADVLLRSLLLGLAVVLALALLTWKCRAVHDVLRGKRGVISIAALLLPVLIISTLCLKSRGSQAVLVRAGAALRECNALRVDVRDTKGPQEVTHSSTVDSKAALLRLAAIIQNDFSRYPDLGIPATPKRTKISITSDDTISFVIYDNQLLAVREGRQVYYFMAEGTGFRSWLAEWVAD